MPKYIPQSITHCSIDSLFEEENNVLMDMYAIFMSQLDDLKIPNDTFVEVSIL